MKDRTSRTAPARRGACSYLPGGRVFGKHQIVDRLDVGLLVGHDFEQAVVQVEGLLGIVLERLVFDLLLRRGVGGRPEENTHLDRLVGDPLGLEQPLQHQAVEGDLEAVFDLDLDGRFHVANEDQGGVLRPPGAQANEVEVAPE